MPDFASKPLILLDALKASERRSINLFLENEALRSADFQERGSRGVQCTGVSQSVRATNRDESQSVPSPQKLLKTRDPELPFFEGCLPSCSPHSAGYTRTFLHPYFPVAKIFAEKCRFSHKEKTKHRQTQKIDAFVPLGSFTVLVFRGLTLNDHLPILPLFHFCLTSPVQFT